MEFRRRLNGLSVRKEDVEINPEGIVYLEQFVFFFVFCSQSSVNCPPHRKENYHFFPFFRRDNLVIDWRFSPMFRC